jgi:hypothetical protein
VERAILHAFNFIIVIGKIRDLILVVLLPGHIYPSKHWKKKSVDVTFSAAIVMLYTIGERGVVLKIDESRETQQKRADEEARTPEPAVYETAALPTELHRLAILKAFGTSKITFRHSRL